MGSVNANKPMLGKGSKVFWVHSMRTTCSSRTTLIALSFLLSLLFAGCEKDLSESKRIYQDDLQDTNNIELSIDTSSMPNKENHFSIEHEEGLVKFHAHGTGEAVGRVVLSELLPELEDRPKISIRVHFERFSKSRFEYEGGPIVTLDTKSNWIDYAPSGDGLKGTIVLHVPYRPEDRFGQGRSRSK